MAKPTRLADPDRVQAVRASGLLDSPPEADFDRLAQIAARLLGAPAAFVTIIDEDRQYLKSAVEGGKASAKAGSTTKLDRSFCRHTIESNEPLIVEDARAHPLLKDNKAIEDGIIAYAGVKFETPDGQPIGAICVVDSKPHRWNSDDIENLRAISLAASRLVGDRFPATAFAEPSADAPIDQSLADAIGCFLRAEEDYAALLEGKGVDLDSEAAARSRVVDCLSRLRAAHERGLARRDEGSAALLETVGSFVEAENDRDALATAFMAGNADLAQLETAIARQMNAADALRICAIDHGIEP